MSVAVDYRPSRKVFSQATRAAWTSQPAFQILIVVMVTLWAAASFAAGMSAGAGIDTFSQQLPTFTYLVLGVAFFAWYPSFAFAADARNRGAVHIEFNRAGVSYRRPAGGAEVPWSALSRAADTRDFYVLAMPNRQLVAVPKSSFGPGEEQRFRLLAATSGVPIN